MYKLCVSFTHRVAPYAGFVRGTTNSKRNILRYTRETQSTSYIIIYVLRTRVNDITAVQRFTKYDLTFYWLMCKFLNFFFFCDCQLAYAYESLNFIAKRFIGDCCGLTVSKTPIHAQNMIVDDIFVLNFFRQTYITLRPVRHLLCFQTN